MPLPYTRGRVLVLHMRRRLGVTHPLGQLPPYTWFKSSDSWGCYIWGRYILQLSKWWDVTHALTISYLPQHVTPFIYIGYVYHICFRGYRIKTCIKCSSSTINTMTVPLRYHIVPELCVNTMADTRLLSACTGLELVLYVSHVSPTTAVNKSDLWKLEEAAKDEALTLE